MPLVEGAGAPGKAPAGSEFNPIAIESDRAVAWTNLILRLLGAAAGGLRAPGAELPGVTDEGRGDYRVVPSEVEAAVLDRELKAKVKAGQWFYFSTDAGYVFKQGPKGRPVEYRRKGTRERIFIKYPNDPPIA
jgi:hypothetical protein